MNIVPWRFALGTTSLVFGCIIYFKTFPNDSILTFVLCAIGVFLGACHIAISIEGE